MHTRKRKRNEIAFFSLFCCVVACLDVVKEMLVFKIEFHLNATTICQWKQLVVVVVVVSFVRRLLEIY